MSTDLCGTLKDFAGEDSEQGHSGTALLLKEVAIAPTEEARSKSGVWSSR